MLEWLANPESWIALLTLILLEVVLGIDNLIFISIATSRLPKHQQGITRVLGLLLAMLTRIALLFTIAWLITLTRPVFFQFSGKDIFLFCGGIFLCYKGLIELRDLELDTKSHDVSKPHRPSSLILTLLEIAILDIVFSLDSIITAIGMLESLSISHESMLFLATLAIILTVAIMLFVSGYITQFIHSHPSIKLLALCFLVLIGIVLILDSIHLHIPKAYVYVTLGFSLIVEIIRILKQK